MVSWASREVSAVSSCVGASVFFPAAFAFSVAFLLAAFGGDGLGDEQQQM